jgi:hypothetical protein
MKGLSPVGVTASQLRAALVGLNNFNRSLATRFTGVGDFLQTLSEQQQLGFRRGHGPLTARTDYLR